jgi:dihydroorotase
MNYDLIIKNGIIVTTKENFRGNIAVNNGKIVKTGNLDLSDTSNQVYDADGKYILPGIIDAHVHFRDPGLTEKEDFESGSIAAVMGGVTMIADMPNVIPVTSTLERFNEKMNIAQKKSYIDFALFALISNDNLDEIEGLKNAGALGFKVFLGTSTGDIACPNEEILYQALEKCSKLGIRTGFHAENSGLNSYFKKLCKYKAEERTEIRESQLLAEARPVISEAIAIQNAVCYAQYTGAGIHIHHVTSGDGARLVSAAKQKGVKISAETCPHYLLLDTEDTAFKVYPPIRGKKQSKELWNAIKSGTIDMIASDHAPHTVLEKSLPVWEAPAGLCGVETFVPLMLNEINKGNLNLNNFVRLASEAPAKIWGVYPQKGNLLPGADADITIVDMKLKKTISAGSLHSKSKTSPYDGMEVQGLPVASIIRGVFVMRDGILTGKKGFGLHVRPVF